MSLLRDFTKNGFSSILCILGYVILFMFVLVLVVYFFACLFLCLFMGKIKYNGEDPALRPTRQYDHFVITILSRMN